MPRNFLSVINVVTRLVITASVVLSASALSNAQNTEPDPLDRVIAELQAGRTEKAIAALDEVVKKYPNNPHAYLLRGSLKMQADPAQALRDFDKVIELNPDLGPAYNQRAFLRLVNNDAVGWYETDPSARPVLVEHGVILFLIGKEKDAQAEFDVLLQSDRALWQKRIDDRIAAVKKLLPVK